MFTLKAGIARVFKAPNLYQSSEGYLLSTRGNGCPNTIAEGSCYLLGNPDLDPEISINKEIGIEFNLNGYAAGVTWFRNDYKNKSSPEPRCWAIPPAAIIFCSGRTAAKPWSRAGRKSADPGAERCPKLADQCPWMLKSESKETGNPLSVIPKYTVNTMLDWQVNTPVCECELDALWPSEAASVCGNSQRNRDPCHHRGRCLFHRGIGTQYQLNRDIRLNAGISNLFDKQLYRENAGASTYNEPGRAYYAGVTLSF
jgi:ferric enterobactin receptor